MRLICHIMSEEFLQVSYEQAYQVRVQKCGLFSSKLQSDVLIAVAL